jgi:hypothetical protein
LYRLFVLLAAPVGGFVSARRADTKRYIRASRLGAMPTWRLNVLAEL